jgi:hypothetical protein
MEAVSLQWDLSSVRVFLNILSTFALTCLAWIFLELNQLEMLLITLNECLNLSFDSQYLENERYNYELLLILAFVLVEQQNPN